MQHRQMTFDETRGYASYANAAKAAEKGLANVVEKQVRWFVMARKDGRFVPVALLNDDNSYLMHYLMNVGFCVTN